MTIATSTDRTPSLVGARALLAAALAFTALAGPAVAGVNVFGSDQDVEIGREQSAELEKQLPLVRDARVVSYVQDLGARLAAQAAGPDFPYVFQVVDASDLNAFALPGGPIYINRGILEAARNDGEIAGVLAHEIAHVAHRHGTEQASKAVIAEAGWSLLGGLLGRKADSDLVQAVGGFGLNTLFLKYSREDETQADAAGVQILVDAGMNPADMMSFFQTLEANSSGRAPTFLSSHPDPGRRVESIRARAQELGVPLRPSAMTDRLREVQAVLGSMPNARPTQEILEGPASGNAPGGRAPVAVEPPSRTTSQYVHPTRAFRVRVPQNWGVVAEREAGATLAPEGGVVQHAGRLDVRHGLLVDLRPLERDPWSATDDRRAHLEAAQTALDQILEASPYLRVLEGTARRVATQAGSALVTELAGRSPTSGIDEHVTFISQVVPGDRLAVALFVSPRQDVRGYEQAVAAVIDSLGAPALQDPRRTDRRRR